MLITTTVNETEKKCKKKDYIPAEAHQDVTLPASEHDQYRCTLSPTPLGDFKTRSFTYNILDTI